MKIVIILAAVVISISSVEGNPISQSRGIYDERTCFMRTKHPFKIVRISCDSTGDPISQVFHYINGDRFEGRSDVGNIYFRNLAHFINELKRAAKESPLDGQIDVSGSNEDSSEDKESSGRRSNNESGRRTFGLVLPLVQMGMDFLGLSPPGGYNFNYNNNNNYNNLALANTLETARLEDARREDQQRATIQNLEVRQQQMDMEARAREADIARNQEISSLNLMISSMQSGQERDRLENNYKTLLAERDARLLGREVESLRTREEISQSIRDQKAEDVGRQYLLDRAIADNKAREELAGWALKAFGFTGDSDLEIRLQNRLQELRLATQHRAKVDNLETKQKLMELEAKGREAAIKRDMEIASLKAMISSMKNSHDKAQIERDHKQLLLERDAKMFEKEIDALKRNVDVKKMIHDDKMSDFQDQYQIDKAISNDKELNKNVNIKSNLVDGTKCQFCV